MADVKVIGLKEANAALRKMPDFAKARIQPVMNATAQAIVAGARARVAVRSGFLKLNIRWEPKPAKVGAVVGVDVDAFYWKFLEFGTAKMGARPFLRPAADAVRDDHDRRLRAQLTEVAMDVERAQ